MIPWRKMQLTSVTGQFFRGSGAPKGIKSKDGVATLTCVFCSGRHGAYETGARCPVCSNSKQITVLEPIRRCAFCKGTGKFEIGTSLMCTACSGKGTVTVPDPFVMCPTCKGRGNAKGSMRSRCTHCGGLGVIAAA